MKHDDAIRDNTAALNELADTIQARDYNGHVPDEDSRDPREDVASDSGEAHEGTPLCPYDRDQPGLRCAWYEGYLACVGIIAARGVAQVDAMLERVGRPAA